MSPSLSLPPPPSPSLSFLPPPSPFLFPFLPNSNFTTSLRITRQRKTQQNLNLSKQAEDPWAQIGRCSSHPYHQGAGRCMGRPLPREGGLGENRRSALLVTCLPVCVSLIQQELVNQKDCPYMCAYKLVTVKFKWWGLQNKVENFIHKVNDQGEASPVCVYVYVGGSVFCPTREDHTTHMTCVQWWLTSEYFSLISLTSTSPFTYLSYSLMPSIQGHHM